MNKVDRAFELFDAYNKQDPQTIVHEGVSYPAEFFYALQLYYWVIKLQPAASEPLLLASRCQHIGRWEIDRKNYPAGKAGYYKWRTDLAKFHAEKAAHLLLEAGYTIEETEPVQRIVRKEGLRTDPDVQTMENALCLVFLQFQYKDFIRDHDDEKVMRIVKKSWAKMTSPGREAAATLVFNGREKELLEKALS